MTDKRQKQYRVAVASFEFEGNDFSPKECGAREFAMYFEASALLAGIAESPLALTGGVDILRQAGNVEIVPILATQGGSGGTVNRTFFESIVSKILEGLASAGQLDGIYLALHGAMTSPGIPDAEGELLERIRDKFGKTPTIAVSLDLHGNVTKRMVQHASILVGYENYPHDDAYTTGQRACRLLLSTLAGELEPSMHMTRLKMLIPVVGGSTLAEGAPLGDIKKFARAHEAEGVASISYFTCQPWLDDDHASNVIISITNGDPARAKTVANEIAQDLWRRREEFLLPLLPVDQAIERALAAPVKPCILADTGDSVGAGAPGDASFVLAHLLSLAGDAKCALSIVDAEVAKAAAEAGVGARLSTAVGFKTDSTYGTPLMIDAEIVCVHSGQFVWSAGPYAGTKGYMGQSAVLRVRNIFILVTTQGTYEYADEQFLAVGIDTTQMDIVVLKNGMNFRNLLKDNSSWYLIDSPGSSSSNLAALAWKNRRSPFWPRDVSITNPIVE